jgi:hypothetical protein
MEVLMSRIDDRFLNCSIYLYPTEEMARNGECHGGSGFLAAVRGYGEGWLLPGTCPKPDFHHCYAVTNKHVARKHPIVRLNRETANGESDATSVIPIYADDWTESPRHDIAIVPIAFEPGLKYLFVDTTRFLTQQKSAMHDVGIGDEVFMVGRFINHEGRQRNNPSVRWGHIGMMPVDVVDPQDDLREPEKCFVIETHSISGYSGSPVFVRPFSTPKLSPRYTESHATNTHVYVSVPPSFESPLTQMHEQMSAGPWLLGIQKSYLHYTDKRGVVANTGMSCVVPSWHILDLLNSPKLTAQRRSEQERLLAHHQAPK